MGMNTDFEISLFRAVIAHRPIGSSKHFAMIGMLRNLKDETGREIDNAQVWDSLAEFYNLKEMDALVRRSSVPRRSVLAVFPAVPRNGSGRNDLFYVLQWLS
jgi:hypothetical protein